MKNFRLKIIATLSLIITTIIVFLMALNYQVFRSESTHLNRDILKSQNQAIGSELSLKFDSYKKELEAISIESSVEAISGEQLSHDLITQLQTLTRVQGSTTQDISIFTISGDVYNTNGVKREFNVKEVNLSFYDAVFNKGESFYVSEPFKFDKTDNFVVAIATKIHRDFGIVSIMPASEILGELTLAEDAFIYSSQGTILHSPHSHLIEKNMYEERPGYKQFSRDIPEITYDLDIDGAVNTYTAFWGKHDISGWQFVTIVGNDKIEKAANAQIYRSLVILVVSLTIAIAVILFSINKLVIKPVGGAPEEIAALMERIASGDLVHSLSTTGKETGIYLSLVNLSDQLSKLVKNSHSVSESVSASSTELDSVMQHTLNNAEHELAQVEQISTAINELSSTAQEVSSKAALAEEETRRAQDDISSGKQMLEQSVGLTDSINDSVSETAKTIVELAAYAEEIGSVLDMINSISEQTNLLALNAAIEAARAGEHGRGFAVVADEVRNLASKTQRSTISIQDVIAKLQSQSEVANITMNENMDLIRESVSLANTVKASFDDISSSVASISEVNGLVAVASQEQHSVTEEISRNATMAYDLVQKNVFAANKTVQAAEELARLAQLQKEELAYFRV